MDAAIIEFSKYHPVQPADKASEEPSVKDRPKKAKIIQFRNRLQLSADGHTIILNF